MKTALIVGIDSVIGLALKIELQASGWSVLGTTRQKSSVSQETLYLDLLNVDAFDLQQSVDVVFLCASITKVAACSEDAEHAYLVNEVAQIRLATYFLQRDVHVVFLSSTAVFNGEKPYFKVDDDTCPTTLYGQYKANVEKALLSMSGDVTVVRLTKVLTKEYPLIIQWLARLKKAESIVAFDDLNFCPISVYTVVSCLKEIAKRCLVGVIHLSGTYDISYLQMAHFLAEMMDANKLLVQGQSGLCLGLKCAELPIFSSLDMTETKSLFAFEEQSPFEITSDLYGH